MRREQVDRLGAVKVVASENVGHVSAGVRLVRAMTTAEVQMRAQRGQLTGNRAGQCQGAAGLQRRDDVAEPEQLPARTQVVRM